MTSLTFLFCPVTPVGRPAGVNRFFRYPHIQESLSKVHRPLRWAGPSGTMGSAGISCPDVWLHLRNKYAWNIEKFGLQNGGDYALD